MSRMQISLRAADGAAGGAPRLPPSGRAAQMAHRNTPPLLSPPLPSPSPLSLPASTEKQWKQLPARLAPRERA
eukprot:scaffold248121_cov28-Tisochrysis_lutea.AAC.1